MIPSFAGFPSNKYWETLRKSYISGLSWLAKPGADEISVIGFPRPPPPWPEVNKVKVPPISGGDLGVPIDG